jgi:hypothetical protein
VIEVAHHRLGQLEGVADVARRAQPAGTVAEQHQQAPAGDGHQI